VAWEARSRAGPYYYRGTYEGGRVVKTYFGRGAAARVAARLDDQARRDRAEESARLRRIVVRLGPADAALADLDAACRLALEAALAVAGYDRRNRKWRRRHEQPGG
jgi:hypothetical protein